MAGPCDLFLAWGQSNMAGRGTAGLSPATTPGMAYEWVSGTGLIQLADPTASTGYESQTGCLLPAFANAFTVVSGRPAIFVPNAVGGTPLLPDSGTNHWGPNGPRYAAAITRALACLADLSAGAWAPTVHVLWCQGESDARYYPGSDLQAAYAAGLVDLLGRSRTDLDLPNLRINVFRTGTFGQQFVTGYTAVRAAQDDATASNPGLVMVYRRCVDFPSLGMMAADQLHYTQAGYNDMGTEGARAVAADLAYDPPPPELKVSSVTAARLLMGAV